MHSSASLRPSRSGSISTTLLELVKLRDSEGWRRLVRMFGPVVYRWARALNLQDSDAADVVQDVFGVVAARVAEFRRDEEGQSFRVWLWTITRYQIREFFRKRRQHPQAAGAGNGVRAADGVNELPPDEQSQEGQAETKGVLQRSLLIIREGVDEKTWKAFWRTVVEGDAPLHVAEDLGVSKWAVYKARSRVLQRLRNDLDGLLEVDALLSQPPSVNPTD